MFKKSSSSTRVSPGKFSILVAVSSSLKYSNLVPIDSLTSTKCFWFRKTGLVFVESQQRNS